MSFISFKRHKQQKEDETQGQQACKRIQSSTCQKINQTKGQEDWLRLCFLLVSWLKWISPLLQKQDRNNGWRDSHESMLLSSSFHQLPGKPSVCLKEMEEDGLLSTADQWFLGLCPAKRWMLDQCRSLLQGALEPCQRWDARQVYETHERLNPCMLFVCVIWHGFILVFHWVREHWSIHEGSIIHLSSFTDRLTHMIQHKIQGWIKTRL